MKKPLDKFSKQSVNYKRYRPIYPQTLYDELLEKVESRNTCWDCGTGNGQVAVELSSYFKRVCATDISQKQLENASQRSNIFYSLQRAEQTNFEDASFDLVTVAQAIHWFDFEAFYREVKRVMKPGGIVAVWGYGLIRTQANIDPLIEKFYQETIGKYWNAERRHIENEYADIPFPFDQLEVRRELAIDLEWTLSDLQGYLQSWSAVQNYKDVNGVDPVPDLIDAIGDLWERNGAKKVHFPIFMKVGRMGEKDQ